MLWTLKADNAVADGLPFFGRVSDGAQVPDPRKGEVQRPGCGGGGQGQGIHLFGRRVGPYENGIDMAISFSILLYCQLGVILVKYVNEKGHL